MEMPAVKAIKIRAGLMKGIDRGLGTSNKRLLARVRVCTGGSELKET
jgi:hypothetical protein